MAVLTAISPHIFGEGDPLFRLTAWIQARHLNKQPFVWDRSLFFAERPEGSYTWRLLQRSVGGQVFLLTHEING